MLNCDIPFHGYLVVVQRPRPIGPDGRVERTPWARRPVGFKYFQRVTGAPGELGREFHEFCGECR